MPLHLLSRRSFIRTSVAAGTGVLLADAAGAAERPDPNHFALFSDTHIAGDPGTVSREVNMAEHLSRAVAGVTSLDRPPAGVIINGDCSLDVGLPEDYATLTELLDPLATAGVPVHMTLGNHDEREVFWRAILGTRPEKLAVDGKHVSLLTTPTARWFLLDSLDVTKQTPGRLGDDQRVWLAKILDQYSDRPALLVMHHNPNPGDAPKKLGLIDTEELLAILDPRRQVKALFFGHTHTWRHTQRDGLHLINLPAVAYPFAKSEVTGWVDARMTRDGAVLTVQATDPAHPRHEERLELEWRS